MTEEIRPENPPAEAIQPVTTDAPALPGKPGDEPIITITGNTLNYMAVAFTFLVVGVLIGLSLPRNELTEAKIEQIVRNVMADVDLGGDVLVDRFELVDDDPYLGEEDAPIVMVEFSDFQCPYCGRHFERTLAPLLENYGQYIRYVYRDFVVPIGPESLNAALAANCASEQGAFWKFHNAFFQNQKTLSRDFYLQLAQENNLDITAFTRCLDEQRYLGEINSDIIDGQLNNVEGTPGFFINGRFIRGAQPYELFEKVILRELEKLGIDPKQQG